MAHHHRDHDPEHEAPADAKADSAASPGEKEHATEYERYHRSMRRTTDLENHAAIKGIDFGKDIDVPRLISSYANLGFQASELAKATAIVRQMLDEKATVFFSFTGNAISSGLREIIAFLVKHKLVQVIITTASGVEEDAIKSLADFKLGDFEIPGRTLFDYGVGRIGNIFVPNDRYTHFERFMNPFFEELYEKQKADGKPISPSEFIRLLGLRISDENSFVAWAARNGIPVYCPGIMDGSIGDLLYFFKQRHPDFYLDVTDDHKRLIDFVLQQEKAGGLVLGGGISKHYSLNAQIFRDGFDYAVYLTTATEYDGSDSGGNHEEAKTWAKVKVNAPTAKVRADFTLTFPLLVAGSFLEFLKE